MAANARPSSASSADHAGRAEVDWRRRATAEPRHTLDAIDADPARHHQQFVAARRVSRPSTTSGRSGTTRVPLGRRASATPTPRGRSARRSVVTPTRRVAVERAGWSARRRPRPPPSTRRWWCRAGGRRSASTTITCTSTYRPSRTTLTSGHDSGVGSRSNTTGSSVAGRCPVGGSGCGGGTRRPRDRPRTRSRCDRAARPRWRRACWGCASAAPRPVATSHHVQHAVLGAALAEPVGHEACRRATGGTSRSPPPRRRPAPPGRAGCAAAPAGSMALRSTSEYWSAPAARSSTNSCSPATASAERRGQRRERGKALVPPAPCGPGIERLAGSASCVWPPTRRLRRTRRPPATDTGRAPRRRDRRRPRRRAVWRAQGLPVRQPRPMLGRLPWLALLRRRRALRFLVFFDIGSDAYRATSPRDPTGRQLPSAGQVFSTRSSGTPTSAARSQPCGCHSSWPVAWASLSIAK